MKMINKKVFNELLAKYKEDFPKYWPNERYKWIAVKWFQEHWDINAEDFSSMIKIAMSKTSNLLASYNNYPYLVIMDIAKKFPEETRAMFINLFDESKDILERIKLFKDTSKLLYAQFETGQHYQNENAITVYLWLHYPDKYYIYKFGEVKTVAESLEFEKSFKKGAYADNILNFYQLYDLISDEISRDSEIKYLLNANITDECYRDPKLKTLTFDFGFYISRYYLQDHNKVNEWFPADYTPNITTEKWVELLKNPDVFNIQSLEIMKRLMDIGGQATCRQLSLKYGNSVNFYNRGSSALAQRIAKYTNCPVIEKSDEDLKWWPILYLGRNVSQDSLGTFEWKIRDELFSALEQVDLESVSLYVDPSPALWKISHGTESTGISNSNKRKFLERNIVVVHGTTKAKGVSNTTQGESFMYTMKKGDYFYLCFGNEVKLLGRITSDILIENNEIGNQWYERPYEVIKESISDQPFSGVEKWWTPNHNSTCIKIDEKELFEDLILKPYFEMTFNELFQTHNIEVIYEKYTKEHFLNEVFMTEQRYDILVAVLRNKKNIILQGAPGVGKTYAANRLAYSMMGEKDETRIEFVQFHQNYSYEDFMMGYKPNEDGFELRMGIFYRFCQQALNQPDKEHFFIIDEINRGNLSKIFGELLMLIEKDYRGNKLTLAYNGLPFIVPKNVYLIGMMNTADRSLAMIDYALRRRFSFFELEPGFTTEGFKKYQEALNNDLFNDLITMIQELNDDISNDRTLGKGFCIGHSYFLGQSACSEEWIHSIIEYEIIPMISEYWFDEPNKLHRWENNLRGIFQ